MHKRKNLYKMDEICLVPGVLLLIPLVVQLLPLGETIPQADGTWWEVSLEFVRPQAVRLGLLSGAALFFLILGLTIRKKEKEMLKIINIVLQYEAVPLPQLEMEAELPLPKIEKYLKEIYRLGFLNIDYDGMHIKLKPNAAPDHRLRCHMCREPLAEPAAGAGESRLCPGCTSRLNRAREQMHSLHAPDDPVTAGSSDNSAYRSSPAKSLQTVQSLLSSNSRVPQGFNIPLFIILFILFWPAAFIYLGKFYLTRQNVEMFKTRFSEIKQTVEQEQNRLEKETSPRDSFL